MIKIELESNRKLAKDLPRCYNRGIKINDKTNKYCPNCHVILNPNDLLNGKKVGVGFVLFLSNPFSYCVLNNPIDILIVIMSQKDF